MLEKVISFIYGFKIPEILVPSAIFYFISAVAVVSAILVVTLKNIFHSALFLALTLLCVAGIFLFLDSGFLAAIQVLIYVGAIITLVIFAIMLTSRISDRNIKQVNEQKAVSFVASLGLLMVILVSVTGVQWNVHIGVLNAGVSEIGKMLLTKYGLAFEVASVVLLVALIGAVALGLPERKGRG